MMESRLNELEAKISLAEDLLDALNRTVFRQQQQIDRLQQDIRALRQQLQEAAPAEAASPGDEIPPHY
jgi:SlyX protein